MLNKVKTNIRRIRQDDGRAVAYLCGVATGATIFTVCYKYKLADQVVHNAQQIFVPDDFITKMQETGKSVLLSNYDGPDMILKLSS